MVASDVEHLVLFRFHDDVTAEKRLAMFEGLRSLRTKIPEIVDLSVGENLTDRGKGYTCGLRVRLRSSPSLKGKSQHKEGQEKVPGGLAALDAYQNHPEHQRVLQTLIKPIVADVLAIDNMA